MLSVKDRFLLEQETTISCFFPQARFFHLFTKEKSSWMDWSVQLELGINILKRDWTQLHKWGCTEILLSKISNSGVQYLIDLYSSVSSLQPKHAHYNDLSIQQCHDTRIYNIINFRQATQYVFFGLVFIDANLKQFSIIGARENFFSIGAN